MTIVERNNKLKHFITCLKCRVSGKNCDDNCPTQYAAGNMGEIIENLEAISKALEQEPCEDAISRAELLKAMDTQDKFGYTETGCFVRAPKNDYVFYVHYDDMVNCVKGMPSVTPQEPRWIPVSEELPKVADCYAVTVKIGSDLMTSACFFDRPNIWYDDNQRNRERNYLTNVVAWMPLPKTYKAKSEE